MHPALRAVAAAAAIAFAAPAASADTAADYPAKPVRWVVAFAPGASNDIIARLVAARLTDAWGQQFIVDNRSGGGGVIGGAIVAGAPADGYTLLQSTSGPSINGPLLSRRPTYRVDDFAHVVMFGYTPLAIVAHPSVPAKNPRELVEWMRANPGKANWGSSGPNGAPHVGLEQFQAAAGVKATHVPYKGSGQALPDIAAGQIQLMHTSLMSADAFIRSGRVKVIGIAGPKRATALPDVPTLAESGIADAEAPVWFGMSAPKHTPRAIVAKLNAQTNRVIEMPDVRRRLEELGLEVTGGSPEAFAKFLGVETARIRKLIDAGVLKRE